MKFDVSRPGFLVSVLAHGTLLVVLIAPLLWVSSPPADDNTPEAVPIETISQNDFNQIMKGEKSSKDVTKEPVTKADKVAEADDQHSAPPKPDVEKEAPPPPPPKPAAPTPPVPTPPVPPPPPPRRRRRRFPRRRSAPTRRRRLRCHPRSRPRPCPRRHPDPRPRRRCRRSATPTPR